MDLGLVVCMRNNQGNEFSLMAVLDPIIMVVIIFQYCEAQGKGRAKGRPRKVTERSFIDMDGGWWLSFP